MLTMVDEEDDIPRRNSEHRKEPTSEPIETLPSLERSRQHTTDER